MNNAACKNEYIHALIKYIENNLSLDLDTKLLSRLVYISHTQLYRDFYSITGHSVKEYVRKRRLSNALALIKSSEFSLADIAYNFGYSSQQTLCRAVKQAVRMTPLEYKNSDDYFFFPALDKLAAQPVTVSTETIPGTLCVKFYHFSLKNIENKAIDTLLKLAPEYGGRIFGRNGKQHGARFCYELYLTDTHNILKTLKTSSFEVSHERDGFTAMFAACYVQNDEEKISGTWNYLYSDWLQNSMFEYSNEHYFEEYLFKNKKPVKLRLYLPIRKRGDYPKITLLQNPRMWFLVSKAKGCNAEQIASKAVIDYLSAQYPCIIKTSREFYIQKSINACTCGVKVDSELRITDDEHIQNIYLKEALYLVLYSSVMGDYDKYCDILLAFTDNNGMIADREDIFAVYDVKDSYENPLIKVYCPVKLL